MNLLQDHLFLLDNLVIWAIMATALGCYSLLIDLSFIRRCDDEWFDRSQYWKDALKTMLAALPLLGLLGTIGGLLKTFLRMSIQKGFSMHEVISGGIAEAMFTTQFGLVMVIPGLLMLAYLNGRQTRWLIARNHAQLSQARSAS